MMVRAKSLVAAAILAAASAASAQLVPDWVTRFTPPQGFGHSLTGVVVDAAGNTYMTGSTGSSSNRNVLVVKFTPEGDVDWTAVYDGPAGWHDQGSGIGLTPEGDVVVGGSTPGAGSYADALVLKFNGATGALIWDTAYNGGEFTADSVGKIAINAAGEIYTVGGTRTDGADGLVLKLSPSGEVLWARSYDGPSEAPYSQDSFYLLALDPAGNPIVVGRSNQNDLHDDFVTTKYSPDGDILWRSFYGGIGIDTPADIVLDAAGDIYITGTDFDFINRVGTVKYANADGALLWSAQDSAGGRNSGNAIALSPTGQVLIAARSDPDANQSNFNENIFVIGRDAATGAPVWSFLYGANCVGCFDVPSDAAVDAAGNLFVGGESSSAPFSADLILFQFDAATGAEIARGSVDSPAGESTEARTLAFDSSQRLFVSGTESNPSTGALKYLLARYSASAASACYANCDSSTAAPALSVLDFNCFLNRYNAGDPWANCDGSIEAPTLNVLDFNCFLNRFATGCP